MLTQQLKNEWNYAKHHTVEVVKLGLLDFAGDLEEYVTAFMYDVREFFSETDFTYMVKGEQRNWDSKQERYQYMQRMPESDLNELCWTVLVHCITQERQTFTQVLGKVYKRFKLSERQALETAADIIAVLNQHPFITVEYPLNTEEGVMMVKSNVKLPEPIQQYLSQQLFVLPSLTLPAEVLSNSDTGYETINDGILLGGKMHNMPLNLGHINRCNSVALRIDDRVTRYVEPEFKEKDDTPEERKERFNQWRQLNAEAVSLYAEFVDTTFYLTHRYDERGRTYARGHHFNTLGDDYRKATIELADRELVQC